MDEINLLDTMLTRYGNMDFIMKLPAITGIDLYLKAIERNAEAYAWDQWISVYPNMTKENFISFDDFLKQLRQPKKAKADSRTDEEIIRDAELILKKTRRSE